MRQPTDHATDPKYVNRWDSDGSPQPFLCKDLSGYGFLLPGNIKNLEDLCYRYLTQPSNGQVEYRPVTHYVLLTFTRSQSLMSESGLYNRMGHMPETETAFWVLTAAIKRTAGVPVADHLAWFIPYVFVDNPVAMVAGREIYGFAKETGWFDIPDNKQPPQRFAVDVIGVERAIPDVAAKRHRLLEVVRTADGALPDAAKAWSTAEDALRALTQRLLHGEALMIPGVGVVEDLVHELTHREVSLVFLKQFYNAANGNLACYQAIVEASVSFSNLRTMALVPGNYQLNLQHLDSHPVGSDLGLQPTQAAVANYRVEYDFTIGAGTEVWRAAEPAPSHLAPPVTAHWFGQSPQPSRPTVAPRPTRASADSAPARRRRGGTPQKIAILGGGVGAMAAAFELTDQPGWQDRYEITVYQLGWRLGGKGASGRNPQASQRIEEHGLHIWLGFYENAFHVMRRCYEELGRTPGAPLATWQDAFKPQNFVVFEEYINGRWIHSPVEYPTNSSVPGDGGELPRVWDYIPMLLQWMTQLFATSPHARTRAADGPSLNRADLPHWWERIITRIGADLEIVGLDVAGLFLERAYRLARALDPDPQRHQPEEHDAILWFLKHFMQWFWRKVERDIETDYTARHVFIMLDLCAATVTGLIADRVVVNGFDSIDQYELREWLGKHGASAEITLPSAWARSGYDLVFGFRRGSIEHPSMAAGTSLRGTLRMLLTYKGAIMWKMQAGMGDTIFTPLYEVLKRRGVKFKFFHRVKNLHLSNDKRTIASIDIGRQVTLTTDDYDPLTPVKGLPCWPSEPRYEQIVEADALQADHVNLESYWTTWKDREAITLTRGKDFDLVILGIALGALPIVCAELIAARDDWRRMVEEVGTVRTQAFQLWLKPSLRGLGWTMPSPVVGGYVEPLDTWADMSQLIDREDFPAAQTPGNIAYFCGPMEDSAQPPFTDPTFPATQIAVVKTNAVAFLRAHAHHLWPAAAQRQNPNGFNWELLVDPQDRRGEQRADAQYYRANVDPSERYVLSLPGSTQYRLKPGGSGFDNLYLVGDWTYTGMNAGCVEAAVMSGMQASQALTGYPETIVGESDR